MSDSLQTYLEAAEGAGKVLAHARLLVRLAAVYQEIVPSHLGQASSVANYKSRVVVIHASNGAVATKLRQMAPTLLATFTQRGFECSGVQVRVHARLDPEAARVPAQKPLSVRTTQELAALSDSLPLSPLRTALENLLARSAKQE
ncbi:MAG: DUF721 domain-containing protein [Candidatus Accumulibacter sp.]|nr:DUF721 domain-containing protein [Accumulibacter sp.]